MHDQGMCKRAANLNGFLTSRECWLIQEQGSDLRHRNLRAGSPALAQIAAWLPHLKAIPGTRSVTEKHCLIDHRHASRNSELTRGRAIEGSTDGHIEPFGIVVRDWRPSWNLRDNRLRRLKRSDNIQIRYV